MNIVKKSSIAVATCLLTAMPIQAGKTTPVSIELVLSVDSSSSISSSEYNLQRTGYANAFRDREVISAIENLPLGIAVTMQLWTSKTNTSLGWYHLKTEADVLAFADVLANVNRLNSSGTDINLGVTTAVDSLVNNNYEGQALLIDVSGDGVSYATNGCDVEIICPVLQQTRDDAVDLGIIINGLPILPSDANADFLEGRVDEHYEKNVIGGVGSFMEVSNGFNDFSRAAQKKILTEIVNNTPQVIAD